MRVDADLSDADRERVKQYAGNLVCVCAGPTLTSFVPGFVSDKRTNNRWTSRFAVAPLLKKRWRAKGGGTSTSTDRFEPRRPRLLLVSERQSPDAKQAGERTARRVVRGQPRSERRAEYTQPRCSKSSDRLGEAEPTPAKTVVLSASTDVGRSVVTVATKHVAETGSPMLPNTG